MEPQAEGKGIGDYAKFTVIGCIAGAFVIACYVLIRYLFAPSIDCGGAIRDRYLVPVLADLSLSESKHNTRLDLILEKWNREKREIDTDAEHKLLAAKIRAICPEEFDNIVVVSSADFRYASALCEGIGKYMENNISICAAGNPLRSAEALLVSKSACTILVEKAGESAHSDVTNLLELLTSCKSRLLGCVLV